MNDSSANLSPSRLNIEEPKSEATEQVPNAGLDGHITEHLQEVRRALAEAVRACAEIRRARRDQASKTTTSRRAILTASSVAASIERHRLTPTASQPVNEGGGAPAAPNTFSEESVSPPVTAFYEDEVEDDMPAAATTPPVHSQVSGAPHDDQTHGPLDASGSHNEHPTQDLNATTVSESVGHLPRRATVATSDARALLDPQLHRRSTDTSGTPQQRDQIKGPTRHRSAESTGSAARAAANVRASLVTPQARSAAQTSAMDQLLSGTGAVHGGVDTPFSSVRVEEPRMQKSGNIFSTHTTYLCVGVLATGEELRAERRYTDFLALQTCLRKQYPALRDELPALPEKKILGKFKSSFVEKRRVGLEAFLLATCETQPAYRFISRFLHRFFSEPSES